MILRHFGRSPDDFDLVADRAGHDLRYAIDSSKLRTELGWKPLHADFQKGLADTIAWYQAHEEWWRPGKQLTEASYAARGQ
jgi:dTDP-glucose 4,6-dehydratase